MELFKYQQIISRAETQFQGLALVSYDEQFHCREANDLSLSWGQVDLELWTVLFSVLAKPHCLTCCSPYQKERVCQPTTLVASLKDPCVLSSTDQVAVLSVPVPSHTCAAIAVPPTTLSSPAPPVSQRTAQGPIRVSASATMANDKVPLLARNILPPVSTPINVAILERELSPPS